jgi:hypothetical protein
MANTHTNTWDLADELGVPLYDLTEEASLLHYRVAGEMGQSAVFTSMPRPGDLIGLSEFAATELRKTFQAAK